MSSDFSQKSGANEFTFAPTWCEWCYRILFNREKVVVSQRRYEGVYNRIADENEPFCEKGGATFSVSSDFSQKSGANEFTFAPTWLRGWDLNLTTSGL